MRTLVLVSTVVLMTTRDIAGLIGATPAPVAEKKRATFHSVDIAARRRGELDRDPVSIKVGTEPATNLLALFEAMKANIAASRGVSAPEAKSCSRCGGTGRAVAYFDGCGWEQRPAREGEETDECRSCGGAV